MTISGSSCSTANCLTAHNAPQHKNNQFNAPENQEKNHSQQASEYVFQGELLEEAHKNNSFHSTSTQSIDPSNRLAIESYEQANLSTNNNLNNRQGQFLNAYA